MNNSDSIVAKHQALMDTFGKPTREFKIAVTLLLAVVFWAAASWMWQAYNGLGVTGLNRSVFWGIYITNFVFFIGVSHAGTLISAILRITKAEWRRPITRMAEVITVAVLFFGVANVFFDLGRPDRMLNIILHPNFRSPLIWDICSVTIYLMGSIFYLSLPLIPDLDLLKDKVGGWRGKLYRFIIGTIGWTGSEKQRARLERIVSIAAVVILPIAVSVHTVVSWVFAMTIQPMWHSTIFGPYFVAGAIFSGVAALLTAMVLFRKLMHLERYLLPIHFSYLGMLLVVMSIVWFYFTLNEYLTSFYGNEPREMAVFLAKTEGQWSFHFWLMVATCFVIPFSLLFKRNSRTIPRVFIASISVNIGMWLERYTIVVPSLSHTRLPYPTGVYTPSWVELSLFAGCVAAFILLYMFFAKTFPIVSLWEVQEGIDESVGEVTDRLRSYYPPEDKPDE
ncbi:MAG: NrfD/PsrC family molybdoenzyme membrane anchor subunit [Candidatus Zixiibacteriota bacterium]